MGEELTQEGGSFDRYLANRAPSLLWSTTAARASVINSAVGVGLVALSVIVCLIAMVFVGAKGLAFGIGPLIGGVINLSIGYAWRRRAKRNSGDTQVSPDIWKFLHGLATHVLGPYYAYRASNLGYYPVSNSWNGWRQAPKGNVNATAGAINAKSAREVLDPRVYELMDTVAYQFNRVHGYLSLPAQPGSSLAREGQQIQVAADQAMVDALSIACTMQQFPENIESLRSSMETCIYALREAAELLGKITSPTGSAIQPIAQASMLRGMLDELRIDSLSRAELQDMEHPTLEQRSSQG